MQVNTSPVQSSTDFNEGQNAFHPSHFFVHKQPLHFKQHHATEWERKRCQRYSATPSNTQGRPLQAALKGSSTSSALHVAMSFFPPELSGQSPGVTQCCPQHWMRFPCRTVTLFSWTFVGVVVLLLFSRCWRRLAASCSSWTNVLKESVIHSCAPPFLIQTPAFPHLAPNSSLTPLHLPIPRTTAEGPSVSTTVSLPTHPTFHVPPHHYKNNLTWLEVSKPLITTQFNLNQVCRTATSQLCFLLGTTDKESPPAH